MCGVNLLTLLALAGFGMYNVTTCEAIHDAAKSSRPGTADVPKNIHGDNETDDNEKYSLGIGGSDGSGGRINYNKTTTIRKKEKRSQEMHQMNGNLNIRDEMAETLSEERILNSTLEGIVVNYSNINQIKNTTRHGNKIFIQFKRKIDKFHSEINESEKKKTMTHKPVIIHKKTRVLSYIPQKKQFHEKNIRLTHAERGNANKYNTHSKKISGLRRSIETSKMTQNKKRDFSDSYEKEDYIELDKRYDIAPYHKHDNTLKKHKIIYNKYDNSPYKTHKKRPDYPSTNCNASNKTNQMKFYVASDCETKNTCNTPNYKYGKQPTISDDVAYNLLLNQVDESPSKKTSFINNIKELSIDTEPNFIPHSNSNINGIRKWFTTTLEGEDRKKSSESSDTDSEEFSVVRNKYDDAMDNKPLFNKHNIKLHGYKDSISHNNYNKTFSGSIRKLESDDKMSYKTLLSSESSDTDNGEIENLQLKEPTKFLELMSADKSETTSLVHDDKLNTVDKYDTVNVHANCKKNWLQNSNNMLAVIPRALLFAATSMQKENDVPKHPLDKLLAKKTNTFLRKVMKSIYSGI